MFRQHKTQVTIDLDTATDSPVAQHWWARGPMARTPVTPAQVAEEVARLRDRAGQTARATTPRLAQTGQRAMTSVRAAVPQASTVAAERASILARRLSDDVLSPVTQRVREAIPAAETVRQDVVQAAETMRQDVAQAAETVRHDVAQAAETVRHDVAQVAERASAVVADRRQRLGRSSLRLTRATPEPAAIAPGQRSRGQVVRQTAGTALWVGLLVAVLYYLCGSAERRQRTLNAARTTWSHVKGIRRDLQGYHQETAEATPSPLEPASVPLQ